MSGALPLDQIHRDLGASMADFAGYDMPMRYGNPVDEHHAVRTGVGLFDLSHMAEIDLAGPGAGAALDYALVSSLSSLEVGQAKYTMLCAPGGGILDDLIVYRRGAEAFTVVANASNRSTVVGALVERADAFDTAVEDNSDQIALLAVQGPKAATVVERLVGADVLDLRYYRCAEATAHDVDLLVARTGYTGEDGFELYLPADSAVSWWERCLDAGAASGLVPIGLAARDTLRLEAGMPLYGHELVEATTPFDTRSGRLVDFGKDTFVGRDALLAASEAPTTQLVGLEVDGKRPARDGYAVIDTASGDEIGVLTSGTKSPTLDKLIAFARLDASVDAAAADLVVDVRGTPTPARPIRLPFYQRPKEHS